MINRQRRIVLLCLLIFSTFCDFQRRQIVLILVITFFTSFVRLIKIFTWKEDFKNIKFQAGLLQENTVDPEPLNFAFLKPWHVMFLLEHYSYIVI